MDKNNQGELQLHIKPLPTILIAVNIILIILFGISMPKLFETDLIKNVPEQGPSVKIVNSTDIIPEDYSAWVSVIEWGIFNTVLDNVENKNISKESTSSYIRENSVKTIRFNKQNTNYVRAIVDIPGLNQSYEVFLEYPDNKEAVKIVEYDNPDVAKPYFILCINNSEEIIYPDFNCKDDDNQNMRGELVSRYLKYFEFENFNVRIIDENFSEIEIFFPKPSISQTEKDNSINSIKEKINSLGISSDIFNYKVINMTELDFTQD